MKRGYRAGKRFGGGFGLSGFTPEDIHELHLASLEVLEVTGMLFEDEESLQILEAGGANVDFERKIAKLPAYMIDEAVRSCPHQFTLFGRGHDNDLVLGGNRISFANFGGALRLIDRRTAQVRPSLAADELEHIQLINSLEEIDLLKMWGNSADVHQGMLQVFNTHLGLSHSLKPFYLASGDPWQIKKQLELATVAAGGRRQFREQPRFAISVCPVSPLKLGKNSCRVFKICARECIPVSVTSMVMSGASAPVTLAGALVIHNAEVLACTVLHQLFKRGAPLIYGSVSTNMDLRFSIAPLGGPEMAMISTGVACLAHFYGLPSNVGGGTDSKVSDAQSGHEVTLTALLSALAGANIITGAGILDSGLTGSFAQTVMDCEFIRMIKHTVRGINLDDDNMALEVVHQIGPGKDFLTNRHTFDHMRTSHAQTSLIDRNRRSTWEARGGTRMVDRARQRAAEILDNYEPQPLSESTQWELDAILAEAGREIEQQ